VDPGISFPLREAELPGESKRMTEVAKTRYFPRSAVNVTDKHIRGSPLNRGVKRIKRLGGGGGIRTHGGYSPHTISSRAH
jgi:hypothetical protein